MRRKPAQSRKTYLYEAGFRMADKIRYFLMPLLVVFMLLPGIVQAGNLTARDYIEIRQLIEGYPYVLDSCSNNGYDYADQYTKDGTFGVSANWGDDGKVWYRGRQELATAPCACKKVCGPTAAGHHHLIVNMIIKPIPGGAYSRSTLLMITGGADAKSSKMQWQGGYEDTFVKTDRGWRFKSRRHVWPGYDWPATSAEEMERLVKRREAESQ